jgi:L-histidine N-alpha-methyltransferase
MQIEFGSGSSFKTETILKTLIQKCGKAEYVPIEISPTILKESCENLLRKFQSLSITAINGLYEEVILYEYIFE